MLKTDVRPQEHQYMERLYYLHVIIHFYIDYMIVRLSQSKCKESASH